jgi:hypothetical protein
MWRYVVWLQVTNASACVHRVGLYSFPWLRNVINHCVTSQKFYKMRARNCQLQPNFANFNVVSSDIKSPSKLSCNWRFFYFPPPFFIPLQSIHCVWRQQHSFLRYSVGRGSRLLVRCITVTMAFLITTFTDSAGNYLPRLADKRHIHIVRFRWKFSM